MTGDTDLTPAFATVRNTFPEKDIRFALPYGRHNNVLRNMAPKSFTIGRDKYANHQLPNPYILSSGEEVAKPSTW